MKFNIVPKMYVMEKWEAKSADDAICCFTASMDSDMNNYMKAVPVDETNADVTRLITALIRCNDLSASECTEIFRALQTREGVIGGKLWTTEDVREKMADMTGGEVTITDDMAQEAAEYVDSTDLDDCTDTEWRAIEDGINDSDVSIHVSDIEWDIDKDDFDSEAEYDAVNENLPKELDIPVREMDYRNVSDYLSDNYAYCVRGYSVDTEGTMNITFSEANTDLISFDTVYAEISKEQVKEIFDNAGAVPKNESLEPDGSYVSGEIQFNFDKDTDKLTEILVFPVYMDPDDSNNQCQLNGDFINAPDGLWELETQAREFLRKNK